MNFWDQNFWWIFVHFEISSKTKNPKATTKRFPSNAMGGCQSCLEKGKSSKVSFTVEESM